MRCFSACVLVSLVGASAPLAAQLPTDAQSLLLAQARDADEPELDESDHDYDPGERPGGYGEEEPVTDYDVEVEEMDKQAPVGSQRDKPVQDRQGPSESEDFPSEPGDVPEDEGEPQRWPGTEAEQGGDDRGDYEGVGQPYEHAPARREKDAEEKPWYRFWE